VDAIDPLDAVDASRFAAMADLAIADVRARGKVPVVCGGTFLWVRALLFGLAEAPPASAALRAEHAEIARVHGRAALHARLAEVDPASAARLHPNDLVRVSRALEVHALGGTPMSVVQAAHGFATPRHRAVLLGLAHTPETLTARIAARTRGWLDAGWIDEVRALRDAGLGEARAMRSVGYREVVEHLDGALPGEELADAIVRATRVFARRQRTWLAKEPVVWLSP
jgi:tRNA dimethylallyltransferase